MKIDKTNGGVCFNEEFHTYWDSNGRYDSVTTIIGKFCHEFDSEFWSLYKALEKGVFANIQRGVNEGKGINGVFSKKGGYVKWETLLDLMGE